MTGENNMANEWKKKMIFYVEIEGKEQEDAKMEEFKKKLIKQGLSENDFLLLPMIDGVRSAYVEFAPNH